MLLFDINLQVHRAATTRQQALESDLMKQYRAHDAALAQLEKDQQTSGKAMATLGEELLTSIKCSHGDPVDANLQE